MARIAREEVTKREEFALQIFKNDLTLSAAKANDKVKERFGSKIRPQRMYKLRELAQQGKDLPNTTKKEVTMAGRKPVKQKRKPGRPKTVQQAAPQAAERNPQPVQAIEPALIHTGTKERAMFLAQCLDALRAKGRTNLKVHGTVDGYAVVGAAA